MPESAKPLALVPKADPNDVVALEHDGDGNLVGTFPSCLVCGRPVVPEPGALGRARKIHVGCQAERDRRLKAAFNPDARPAPAVIATSSAAPAPVKPPQFKKQCNVRDRQTGSVCKILAPHDGHAHCTERGPFYEVLGEGETPRILQQIDVASSNSRTVESQTHRAKRSEDPRYAAGDPQEIQRRYKQRVRAEQRATKEPSE